jgi:serine/threonine protein kinase
VYNAPDWLSSGAKDLLSRMLTLDPEQRITLDGVSGVCGVLGVSR